MKRLWFLLLPLLFLIACASDAPPPETVPPAEEISTSAPDNTALPSPPTEVAATETAAPEAGSSDAVSETPTSAPESAGDEPEVPTSEVPTSEVPSSEVPSSGRTDDGAYFLGRTDAPVTIIDYSDFL